MEAKKDKEDGASQTAQDWYERVGLSFSDTSEASRFSSGSSALRVQEALIRAVLQAVDAFKENVRLLEKAVKENNPLLEEAVSFLDSIDDRLIEIATSTEASASPITRKGF